jgi:IrrE N-terminal-like domain
VTYDFEVAEELRPRVSKPKRRTSRRSYVPSSVSGRSTPSTASLSRRYGRFRPSRLGELREDGAKDRSVRRLLSEDGAFSATTAVLGTKRLIVYNPRQTPGRSASNGSHELSHLILEHDAAPPIGIGGCRHWDGVQKAEADWLGAAMLVPRERALEWMLQNGDLEGCAKLRRQRRIIPLARQPYRRRPAGRAHARGARAGRR